MERYLDQNVGILRRKLGEYCHRGEVVDLKRVIDLYVIGVLGELTFGKSFDWQETEDEFRVPPAREHSLLVAVTGSWQRMTTNLKKWLPKVQSCSLQCLSEGHAAVVAMASECVRKRMAALDGVKQGDGAVPSGRKDILTSLILAKYPDTGESLTYADLQMEAFGPSCKLTQTSSNL
jgi:hypothetical protein